jgi:hypothetical protein
MANGPTPGLGFKHASSNRPRRPAPKVPPAPSFSKRLRCYTRAIRLSDDFMKSVDGWRVRQNDAPNRSEAIRRLVEIGLKAKK